MIEKLDLLIGYYKNLVDVTRSYKESCFNEIDFDVANESINIYTQVVKDLKTLKSN